ncbi:hypothetical protein V8C40DRAFT_175539 [Trichoderma camerunense]
MLRCTSTGTRTDRYEHWYSLLDQMCPHQYQASIPRRAFIRWVPDLRVPEQYRDSYCPGTAAARPCTPSAPAAPVFVAQSLHRNQTTQFLALCLVDRGLQWASPFLAVGAKAVWPLSRDLKASSAITPNPCLCMDGRGGGSRNACKALVSSRLLPSHTTHRGRKRSQAGTNMSLSLSFASTSATVQGPFRRRNPGQLGRRYQQTHCR